MSTRPRQRLLSALRFAPLALALAAWLPVPVSVAEEPAAAGDAAPPSPTELAAVRLKGLTRRLSLTEEQQASIRPILERHYRSLHDLPLRWGKAWRKRAQLRNVMQQLDRQTNAQIEKHLTETQVAKYREEQPGRSGWLKPAPPPNPNATSDRSASK